MNIKKAIYIFAIATTPLGTFADSLDSYSETGKWYGSHAGSVIGGAVGSIYGGYAGGAAGSVIGAEAGGSWGSSIARGAHEIDTAGTLDGIPIHQYPDIGWGW